MNTEATTTTTQGVDRMKTNKLYHGASEAVERDARTIDRHSINCYFCGELFDERECMPADEFNNDDGGDICEGCRQAKIDHKNI